MSKAGEQEGRRLENERTRDRCKEIGTVFGYPDDRLPEALTHLAGLLLADATYISEQRRKGWQSTSREYTAAARILEQWARDFAEHAKLDTPPERPNPHRAPLDEIPRHFPPGVPTLQPTLDSTSIDAKLEAAFGPLPEPVRHIAIAGVTDQTWCEAIEGTRTNRGHANCPRCIELWEIAHPDLTVEAAEPVTIEPESAMFTEPGTTKVVMCGEPPYLAGLQAAIDAATVDPEFQAYMNGEIGFTPPQRLTSFPSEVPTFSEPSPPPQRQTQQRMTFAEVREHGMARARGADHRSYSQVQSFSECGVRYALSDLDGEPAWWNVGGTALHYAIESVNIETYGGKIQDRTVEDIWTPAFGRAISETVKESGLAPDRWRAAKSGKEGYDWWRVEGPLMVGRWMNRLRALYDDGWRIATIDGKPAVELSADMFIPFENPEDPTDQYAHAIKVENIIDLVIVRGDTFMIVDFKSGASAPDSTYQLGQYGWALIGALGGHAAPSFERQVRVIGAYWLARSDSLTPVHPGLRYPMDIDLRELHPWAEVEYLITTMHQAESQGLYLPNKSKSDRFGCGSCGVRGLCPVGPVDK